MKLKDILKREKLKERINQEINSLEKEIKEMTFRKTFSDYDQSRTVIGEATALSDLEEEIKETIFEELENSYEDSIIKLNKDRISFLRNRLKNQLKSIM